MRQQETVKPQLDLRVTTLRLSVYAFASLFEEPGDFDILMVDPQLGSLALTTNLDLDVREEGSDWRRVTLD
jgi:hypothetical protein